MYEKHEKKLFETGEGSYFVYKFDYILIMLDKGDVEGAAEQKAKELESIEASEKVSGVGDYFLTSRQLGKHSDVNIKKSDD